MTMDAENLVDELVWKVLLKIKKKETLTDIGLPINFGYSTEEEEQVLVWLQKEKFIELLNSQFKSIISMRGVIPEDIKLSTIQPHFDELYQEYRNHFSPQSYQKINTSEAKQRVKEIITTKGLKGRELLFFKALSSMKPISLNMLSKQVNTKNIKELKLRVQKKFRILVFR